LGIGLGRIFARLTRASYIAAAIVFVLALVAGELAGGSVTLVAPLLVPLLVGLPLLLAGARDDRPAIEVPIIWRLIGYIALPVAVVAGFMAATFLAPPLLAAHDPARSNHTATLLDDGRVLIVGGSGDHGPLATAWLYDPANGHWTRAPDMSAARRGHTATKLRDGRVLVVGGDFSFSRPVTELYDPGLDAWSAAHTGAATRPGSVAALL